MHSTFESKHGYGIVYNSRTSIHSPLLFAANLSRMYNDKLNDLAPTRRKLSADGHDLPHFVALVSKANRTEIV
jgi:hypothetical protein